MHENILAAVIRLDEAKALRGVEPLHCSLRHETLLSSRRERSRFWKKVVSPTRMGARSQVVRPKLDCVQIIGGDDLDKIGGPACARPAGNGVEPTRRELQRCDPADRGPSRLRSFRRHSSSARPHRGPQTRPRMSRPLPPRRARNARQRPSLRSPRRALPGRPWSPRPSRRPPSPCRA
jgi:hypothetical protein